MGLLAFQAHFNKIVDLIVVSTEVVLAARRMIFATLFGLIIALTVISQSSILIESYRQKIFEELMDQGSYYSDEGDVTIYVPYGSLQSEEFSRIGGSKFFTNFTEFDQLINNSLTINNYTDYLDERLWFSEIVIGVWLNRTDYRYESSDVFPQQMLFYASSNDYFYEVISSLVKSQGKGRFPQISSELLLIRPRGFPEYEWDRDREEIFENLTVGTEINLTFTEIYNDNSLDSANQTAKIVGVLEYNREYMDRASPYSDDLSNIIKSYLTPYFPWEGYFFLYNRTNFPQMIDLLLENVHFGEYFSINGEVNGRLTFDRSKFNVYNINQEITHFEDFLDLVERQLYSITSYSYIFSSLLQQMRMYEGRIQELNIFLLLISIPILAIALYLVNFSFELIKRQKQEHIGIIKTRGGSWVQLLIILLGEMLLSTLIAVFIGFLFSTLLAELVMRSTDFLEFLGPGIPVIAPVQTLRTLIMIGVVIALLLNFRRIFKMSKMKITDTLDSTKEISPFWKRFYLDVVMFAFGTVVWLILMSLLESVMTPSEEFNPIIYILYPIFFLLGIPAPFLMLFGSLMMVSRIFPILIDRIGNFMWNIKGGINAFSVRNIIRHKRAANQAVLLITFAVAFAILSASLVYSLEETQRLRYYYEEGSDLSLTTGQEFNNSIKTVLEENISDISEITEIYLVQENSMGYIGISYTMMFLDPITFPGTIFKSPVYGLSDAINNLMEELQDNNSILLLESNFQKSVSVNEIGDNLSLSFSNDTGVIAISPRIAGTFNYWPSMYPTPWLDYDREYFLVGSLGMFEKLDRAYFTDVRAKYLMKLSSQGNVETVYEEIKNKTGISPNCPLLKFEEYKESFDRHFSLSILNSDLIVTGTISIIGVVMFGFFTLIERNKEIGVERALGMTRKQTAQSLVVEAITILDFGLIIGCIAGTYFVSMFLKVLSVGYLVPPSIVSYPIEILIRLITGIVLLAVLGTIGPAFYATRRDISRILKVE